MVHLNIYLTKSERTALTKTLENKIELEGVFRDPTDILNPSIEIEGNAVSIAARNYFEIPEFNRKYFITEVTSLGYGRVLIHGHVDVLSTYADSIRNNSGIIGRSENKWKMYLDDNMIKVDSRPIIVTQQFKDGGYFTDTPGIALVVVG